MNKKELKFYKEVDRKIKSELKIFSKEALEFVEQKLKSADLKTKNQVKKNIERNIARILELMSAIDLENIDYDSPERKADVIREAKGLLKEICIFFDILTGNGNVFGHTVIYRAGDIKRLFNFLKHRVYLDDIFYCLKEEDSIWIK